jgi:hypothetical protein
LIRMAGMVHTIVTLISKQKYYGACRGALGAIPFLVEIDEAPMVGYASFTSWFETKFNSTWSA